MADATKVPHVFVQLRTPDGDSAMDDTTDAVKIFAGTGATDLGKAIDDPVGATDTGVLVLGVHAGEAAKIAVAEEDFTHLHIGELGGLSVEPEQHNHLDELDALTGWAVLGNDTINLLTTNTHLTGTKALTFDKTDGLANTKFAGIEKTITTLDLGELDLHDIVQTVVFLTSIALVDYVFIRIGTDASNYNEWRVDGEDIVANQFTILGLSIGAASQLGATGTGVNWASLKYIALGVAFDAEGNELSGIIFDQLGVFTNAHTTASLSAEVTSSVSSPNVNVKKWGSKSVTLGAGNSDTGTLRVVLASDQNTTAVLGTATYTEATTAGTVIGAVRNDDLATLAGTDNEIGPLQMSQNGALLMCPAANDDYKYAIIDAATSGNNTIQAAVASRKLRILDYVLVASGTVNVRWESGADGTALSGQMELVANTGVSSGFNPAGHFETGSNVLLNLELSAAQSVDGHITYIEVA